MRHTDSVASISVLHRWLSTMQKVEGYEISHIFSCLFTFFEWIVQMYRHFVIWYFFYLELPQKETIHMRLSQFLPQKQLFSEQYTAINCSFQQQLQTIYINLLKRMDNFSFHSPQYYYLEWMVWTMLVRSSKEISYWDK